MKVVARVVTTVILGALFLTSAFADEIAKADTNLTTTEVPTAATDSTGYLAPTIPMPLPQAKLSGSSSSDSDTHPPADIFLGFSYVRFNTNALGIHEDFKWMGFTGAIAGNVNRWFSLVADFGVYGLKDTPPHTTGLAYTFLFGPQFVHRGKHWAPFAHALFGDATLSQVRVTQIPSGSAFFNRSFSQNVFATAIGGGLDVNLNKVFSIRLIQAEYLLTKFTDGNNNTQNTVRASAGLVFHFGGNPPPPPPNHPPTVSVTIEPTTIIAGSNDSVSAKALASDPDNDTLTYKWTATGGTIEGSGPEVHWNTTGLTEGKYTITVTVDDTRGGTATASADLVVSKKPNTPPTITCAASPGTITAGQRTNIAANASDVDNDTLTYSYQTTGGRITGTGANVQYDSTGVAPGNYTITCHVSDGNGGETDAITQVTVQPAAPPKEQVQLEQRLSLHSIYFATAKPTAINPDGGLVDSQQATLVTLAADFQNYLRYKPDAHLILQGHADPRGGEEYNKQLSDRRVVRTKAFLVKQGVSADAIDTQALGEEQPMSVDQVKQAVDQDQTLTDAQKAQLTRNAKILALAQSRRVDVTLSTTGQTSVRQFPFNAADAFNLINPKGTGTAAPGTKGGTSKAGTSKAGTSKAGTKKAPPKKQ